MRRLMLLSFILALSNGVAAQTGSEVVEISMRRTACLGRCPIYDLVLGRPGAATYNGVSLTPRTGRYRASVDSAVFEGLVQHLVDGGFFSLDTVYISAVTDMPTTFLCMRTAVVTRCIRHEGHSGPPALSSLEDAVDAVAAGLTWLRSEAH